MKKTAFIILTIIGAMFLFNTAKAEELITSLRVKDPNGDFVTVMLDACYDPVTKRWEPCYVVDPNMTTTTTINKKRN